jgi:integrase
MKKPVSTILKNSEYAKGKEDNANILFDRKIEIATEGLIPYFSKLCYELPHENALTIANYIISMKTEINPSPNYRKESIRSLYQLSKYCNHKSFRSLTRQNILKFLDSFRKPEASDPLHKWIGTYNLYRMRLMRFFKWLYYPHLEPDKRPKSDILENIPKLTRKEKSVYKPTDLWTNEEDLLFLRYCPSKRMKCYHAMARDLGCRPHEILKLKIKDIVFKSIGTRQYAETVVNGKTGTRPLPLIDSLPYVKDYLNHEHPQPGNPNAVFISGVGKSLGRELQITSLHNIYGNFKKVVFPKLLDNPNISPEDKQKIKELLKKP